MSSVSQDFAQISAAIAGTGLLDGIGEADAKTLIAELRPQIRILYDNEVLCRSKAKADRMWILVDGRICVTEIAGGLTNTVAFRERHTLVGEVGVIHPNGLRSATMVALGRTTVIEIHRACIEGLSSDGVKAAFWRNVAVILARKLSESVDARAVLAADIVSTEKLLRRFVNDYALAETRTDLKAEYAVEHAVIWFSDLVGFSSITERVAPVQAAKIIREAMTLQSAAIEANGGEIDKFIGDGLMAYWIVRGTRAEDISYTVNQAFAAAEAAIIALGSLRSPVDDSSIGLRIGLNFGTPHIGNFGSEHRAAFTLIGHDVNIAARLEQVGHGLNEERVGAIRVGEQFYQHLDNSHQARLVGPIPFQVKKTRAALFTTPCPHDVEVQ